MSEKKIVNCPQCGKEMVKHGKRSNFFIMFLVSLIIWPMFLFLPFAGFLPVRYTCKPCKKNIKEKDLAV